MRVGEHEREHARRRRRRSRRRACRRGSRRSPRRAGPPRSAVTVSSPSAGSSRPGGVAGVRAEDAEPAGVGHDRDRAAVEPRAGGEERRRRRSAPRAVSARITPAWWKSASTAASEPASAAVCELAARWPLSERAALEREDRLAPRDSACDPAESPRVPERLDVEQDRLGRGLVLPPLEQVVRRDVGLVPDRDEGRQAEAPRDRGLEEREPERAALRREADVARRRRARREGRIEAGPATEMPRQFGPIRRAPCARTSASSRSWRSMPSLPVSAKPAEMTTSARTPRASACSAASTTPARRDADDRDVDRVRDLVDRAVAPDARDRRAVAVHGVGGSLEVALDDVPEELAADRSPARATRRSRPRYPPRRRAVARR